MDTSQHTAVLSTHATSHTVTESRVTAQQMREVTAERACRVTSHGSLTVTVTRTHAVVSKLLRVSCEMRPCVWPARCVACVVLDPELYLDLDAHLFSKAYNAACHSSYATARHPQPSSEPHTARFLHERRIHASSSWSRRSSCFLPLF